MRALRIAATGMAAQQLNVEVISNNIANMNTVGFKRQRAEFQDLLYQNVERMGAQSSDAGTVVPTGIQIGSGVKAGAVYRITEQGALTRTENQLDLAINGKGLFPVLLPSGETAYTRAGNFSVNAEGQLVTDDGYIVQPAITIPAEARRRRRSPRPARSGRSWPARPRRRTSASSNSPPSSTRRAWRPSATTCSWRPRASGAAQLGAPGAAGLRPAAARATPRRPTSTR